MVGELGIRLVNFRLPICDLRFWELAIDTRQLEIAWFMVPMRDRQIVDAFHEPTLRERSTSKGVSFER